MRFNLSLRIGAAIAMTSTAVLGGLFFHFFNTTWSNRCDPGNAQYNILKSDPSTSFHPSSELYTWESPGPDNSWLCVNPTLTEHYVGPDVKAIYNEARANLTATGWTEEPTSKYTPPNQTFTLFNKTADGGVNITAFVSQEWFSVQVFMDAPGLHLGEQGWTSAG